MRYLAAAAMLVFLVAGFTLAQPAPNRFLVTPGVGVGPVRIGMNTTDVVSILGPPKATTQSGTVTRYFWFDFYEKGDSMYFKGRGGLYVKSTPTNLVTTVVVYYAPEYVTDNGLHTGLTEEAVRAKLGPPDIQNPPAPIPTERHYLFYRSGIGFAINDNPKWQDHKKVFAITVFTPQ